MIAFLFLLSSSVTSAAHALDLRPGDILLQSQRCFVCALIEAEEGLPYSHVGVVVKTEDGQIQVLESWNRVQRVSLSEFLARRQAGTKTLIRRPELLARVQKNTGQFNQWMNRRYTQHFSGHSYDRSFLWNNSDPFGEKLYCSEFVAKLLNPALTRPLATKPMHFLKFRYEWVKYFSGSPPDGEPGISPADLARSSSFRSLGTL